MEGQILVLQELVVTDPRFFRRYLDILDEQGPTSATVNVDDNTSATVDTAAKTIGMQTKVGDNLNLQATQDFSTAKQGAGTLGMDYQMDPNTSVGVTATQAGYKGQMTPTQQIRASSNLPDVGKIDARVDKGAMFQGAGKNIQPGNPAITTAKVTNPQGQTATYSTNRNL
jgi:hypothetical protein